MPSQIKKCICHNISFSEIQILLQKESLEELKEKNLCCSKCQYCVPYVLKMIETGETEFENFLKI